MLNIYPNPVNSQPVLIDYILEDKSQVKCQVYDAAGRIIRTLISGEQIAGQHTVSWDQKDNNGSIVNAGIYFIRLDTENDCAQGKLIITN